MTLSIFQTVFVIPSAIVEKGQNNLLLKMWNDEICKAVIWLEKRNLL